MEKHLVIAGVLFVMFGVTYGQIFRRDYYFDQEASGWLKLYALSVKWEEALLTCFNDGAILASPLNEGISDALSTMMIEHGVTAAPMFTGVSNLYAKSEYQSMEGVPLSNLCVSWSKEPNVLTLASDNYCIAMYANGSVTAVSCSDPHPFACYRKTGIELNECGPVEKGYTLNSRTGSCYKAVDKLVSWPEAFKFCAREGGHLAIINSQAEAEVMVELAKQINVEYVNIGFYSWGDQPTWMTIHGQSLDQAGYSKWAPNEPNGKNERCGTLYVGGSVKNGVLNDAYCDYPRKFICEIDPKMGTIPSL